MLIAYEIFSVLMLLEEFHDNECSIAVESDLGGMLFCTLGHRRGCRSRLYDRIVNFDDVRGYLHLYPSKYLNAKCPDRNRQIYRLILPHEFCIEFA